jgi:hypothetical protein
MLEVWEMQARRKLRLEKGGKREGLPAGCRIWGKVGPAIRGMTPGRGRGKATLAALLRSTFLQPSQNSSFGASSAPRKDPSHHTACMTLDVMNPRHPGCLLGRRTIALRGPRQTKSPDRFDVLDSDTPAPLNLNHMWVDSDITTPG